MSEMQTNSKSSELTTEMRQMIEHKRRLAIEMRNKRQAMAANHVMTTASVNTSSTSNTCMTHIKPKDNAIANKSTMNASNGHKSTATSSSGTAIKKTQLKASMRLISSKRFAIDLPYNQEVISLFRRVESRDWNPNTKQWTFDVNDYKKMITDLQTISSVDIQFVDSVPDRVMNALIEVRNRSKEDIDLSSRLGPRLMERLFEFQVEGVVFGIRTGGRCLIADDMGLGKTLQAIGIAQWYREDWPLLIVCPSSLKFQWKQSVIDWLPEIQENDVFVANKEKESLPKVLITIISYDLLGRMRNCFDFEYKKVYNFVILDESHYIKNDSAVRTEAVNVLTKSSKRLILLTGTPALSRPMELFTQINLINAKLFTSKHEFGVRYCDGQLRSFFQRGKYGKQRQIWDYKGATHLDELKILLEATLLVRRLKSQVLSQLTKKKREMIIIKVDHISDKEMQKLNNYANITKKLSFKSSEQNTSLFEWFMESAMAKVEPVCHYLEQLLNQNIKLLCFCHHRPMMDSIQEVLAHKRINHIRIDGSTLPHDRQEACNEFQTVADCRVALLSITACATGLNLTAASVVVFAEIFWNPGILAQAEDRVHRIGQEKDVKIYYLVAKNTIDDMIWPMISKKLEVLNKAGLSKDNFNEASNSLNALEAEQHLITEFFSSLDDTERKALMEDDF